MRVTTVERPTLAGFLLARVAEDETYVRHLRQSVSGISHQESGPMGAARVLAECEAKRQIVEMWWHSRPHDDGWYQALQNIALPYASHVDYRPEWRP